MNTRFLNIAPEHAQWIVYLCVPGDTPAALLNMPDAWIGPDTVSLLSGTSCAMMVPSPAPVPLSEPLFI